MVEKSLVTDLYRTPWDTGIRVQNMVLGKTRRGNPRLMIGLQRFTVHRRSGPKIRWQCAKRSGNNCNATAYTVDDQIIKILANSSFIGATFGVTKAGNPVIEFGQYRFNRVNRTKESGKVRWTCNKNPSGCRASIVTLENVIIKTLNRHNH
ncbi:hypothetical protein EVAR_17941_1 [Eumeta japonica]|uniref:FLYWCH-type domain-containing protein n=1 Tax=Eumeta variegata TaxID=151549 RepID=A0A4C1UZS3_EUMVA|nr:hypothetical protein EVAR_17941_1 [Eumeta japonica]